MSQEAHKQSTTSFVKEQERKSRKTIKDHRESIDALCWEFEYLDDSLARLKNKKECYNMDVITRNEEMDDINERMTRIIQDINLYKECINAEKKEMKNICRVFSNEIYEDSNEEDNKLEEQLKVRYNSILDIFEDTSEIRPPNSQLYYTQIISNS
jgi:uncharacterized protein YerC